MGVSQDARPFGPIVVAQDMVWLASRFGEKGSHDGLQVSAMGTEGCETHSKCFSSRFSRISVD